MIKKILKKIALQMMKLLYPDRCPLCQCISDGICENCRKKMPKVTAPYCFRCGKPVEDPQDEYCADCIQYRHVFEKGRGFLLYQGSVRDSIHRIKYQNKREYLEHYAKEMSRELGRDIFSWNLDVIIPVPMDSKKMRRRGYDQAAILAKCLGKELDIGWKKGVLTKIRRTRDQKELTHQQRRSNLKNAFAVSEQFLDEQGLLPWKTVLLVDDVYTTGSTIDEAARILKQHGVHSVFFVTICIGGQTCLSNQDDL